jgi:LDH2 family malate/lactate/ureidoglycolate dehydrogenase
MLNMPTFTAESLRRTAQLILEATGTPPDLAQVVSEALVEANLAGHDSHGMLRLIQYIGLVRQGQVQPAARASLLSTQQATARIDGARGWGQPAARLATQTAIRLAQAYGVGVVTIERCNHIGRLGEYVENIARAGLIGLTLCNVGAAVVPFGGRQARLGTNPMAWGVPRGAGQDPLVLDFATSVVAEGKVRLARAKGEQVPPGYIIDRDGRPTIEPADFYDGGALLPFGGYKGYGLSVMIELVGGALSGLGSSTGARYLAGNGTMLMALNIPNFVPLEAFTADADELSEKIHSTPAADGFSEVLLPGEPELRSRRQRLAAGIPVPQTTWQDIQALADELNVTL